MKDEFYSIAFRKKIYHSLEELQRDVDEWLVVYNHQRPHMSDHPMSSDMMMMMFGRAGWRCAYTPKDGESARAKITPATNMTYKEIFFFIG